MAERLTKTSDKGGLAFTFGLDVTCKPSEMAKILALGEHLKAYEDLGPVEELAALKEAEDDGRLVVLPCKRGDTVYRLCGPKGIKRIVERPVSSVEFNGSVTIIHSTADDILGKTVFLTRAEAEKALGKEAQS